MSFVMAIPEALSNTAVDLASIGSEFRWGEDYNLFFLFSIPVSLALIKVVDWGQYRWRQ